jgi:hypothetical protein
MAHRYGIEIDANRAEQARALGIETLQSNTMDVRCQPEVEDGQTVWLHGKMAKEQFEQLTKLLESADFRALSADHGGLIFQDAETFGAEIPLGDGWRADGTRKWLEHKAWRLQWLNADGESPFPDSVAKIVDWLQLFRPKNGKSFVYAQYPDVCPSGGLRLLQPTVADNQRP